MNKKKYGWTGKLLRVDLSKQKTIEEEISDEILKKYLGCRGIASKLYYDNVPTDASAYSPENCFIISTGPLNGTILGGGRLHMKTRSNRGTFSEGDIGGFFAPMLKYAGYDHILITGKSEKPLYLWVDDDNVELRDASHLWGKNTHDAQKIIRDEVGDESTPVLTIGQGGENLVRQSVIISNFHHSGCRGGGEILGYKKLKAIAARGTGEIDVADPDKFEEKYYELRNYLDMNESDDHWCNQWGLVGPPVLTRLFNELGGLQSYNAQELSNQFAEGVGAVEYMSKFVKSPQACFGCPFPGEQHYYEVNEGRYAGTTGANLRAATSISFMTLLGIDNFSLALKARDLCNKYGLDIFKVGYTLSWAFESYEKGLLNKDDTNGLELKWGNEDILIKLIKKMAKKEGFGKILSSGAAKAAEKYGEKAKKHALAVKEQELEGMPLRKAYVPALGIATAEPGPDHTRFYPPYPPNPSILNEQIKEDLPFDISNALDTSSPVEKGTLVKWLTDSRAVLESFPFCVFLARDKVHVDFRFWTELFNAATGMELSFDDLMKAGERIVNLERSMIVRYGYRRGDDTLPGRMLEDSAPSRYVSSISNETLEKMKDNYYKDREWDKDTGIPTKNKLNDLELHFVVEDLEEDGIYEED